MKRTAKAPGLFKSSCPNSLHNIESPGVCSLGPRKLWTLFWNFVQGFCCLKNQGHEVILMLELVMLSERSHREEGMGSEWTGMGRTGQNWEAQSQSLRSLVNTVPWTYWGRVKCLATVGAIAPWRGWETLCRKLPTSQPHFSLSI